MDGSHDGPTSLVTEVTPNRVRLAGAFHTRRTIPCVVWSEAASARACRRLRRTDLDSEGDNEEAVFGREAPARLKARAQVSRRTGQSEPRNHDGVLRVRSSSGASRILANKRDRPEDVASAAVFGAHAWGRR